tara:strand:- start:398 stop:778 length:381 start_codon:yes stop_codon:yes gene_type:complete
MKINKSSIILIVGILSYIYLINNIETKFNFVLLYLLLLLFGFYFIKDNIFLYAPILILLEYLQTNNLIETISNKNNYVEEATNDAKKKDDKSNYEAVEFDKDTKKDFKNEDEQDKLIDVVENDDNN